MTAPRTPAALARRRARDGALVFSVALTVRLAVVAYAWQRFPPADDGAFYDVVARRIAAGDGYTWLWPDGVVTYAAHYPVGYPALIGLAYAAFGASPGVAMLVNAVFGAALALATHGVLALARPERPRAALLAGLLAALSPSFVLYTPALMTEATAAAVVVTACWLAVAVWAGAVRPAWRWLLGPLGAALLFLRPQLLPFLPALGVVAWPEQRTDLVRRLATAAGVTAIAVALCLPWTARNCARMDGCVFVSANGGWNLLIGTLPEGKGSFAPITGANVPPECREVYGEAGKDRCFGAAAARRIQQAPGSWLGLVPAKWSQLFDHASIAAYYLAASNPALASDWKWPLGAVETVAARLLLVAALWGLWAARRTRWSAALAVLGSVAAFSRHGFAGELALLVQLAVIRPAPWARPVAFLGFVLLALTFATHAVFFGAARYALPWLAFLPLLLAPLFESFDRSQPSGR